VNSIYDTQANYAAVTAPIAAQVLCTVTPVVAGYYKIECYYATSGTTTNADSDNVQLNVPGNPPIVLTAVQGTGAVSAAARQFFAYCSTAPVTITAIAGGGVSAVYRCELAMTLWPREENTVMRTS
jgi:hypothetical protein